MTKITTGASVSLDGFISGPAESGFEHLFAWYGNGPVNFEEPDLPAESAAMDGDLLPPKLE